MYEKILGKVTHGEKVGHNFGIATANISPFKEIILKDGVYFSETEIEQKKYSSIMHYGDLKTFGREKTLEIHIFDFNQDIYDKEISITPLKFHRETEKFKNADELFTKIEDDIVQAEKFFLRRNIQSQWADLSEYKKNTLNQKALKTIEEHKLFKNAQTIALYAGTENELQFAQELTENNPHKTYLFPKVISATEMIFVESKYKDLIPGKFEILEPQENRSVHLSNIDLLITPTVAIDKNNTRLGHGGGFYDRILTQYNGPSLCITPSFATLEEIPKDQYDQSVTEKIELSI